MGAPKPHRMPVAFTAHGSPLNALGGTPFSLFLEQWGRRLPRPRAVLVVSAHWERRRLAVTGGARPGTIHDFYGFPSALYELAYPAAGAPDLAERVRGLLTEAGIEVDIDPHRGLDHGAWAPLLFLFPDADVPVMEVSLLQGASTGRHLEVGRALAPLRDEEVLVLGSGNLVHNLGTADLSSRELPPESWALDADQRIREALDAWNLEVLVSFPRTEEGRRAHPTTEHYAPLLVACGAADPHPAVRHVFESFEHGTLSMRCVQFE